MKFVKKYWVAILLGAIAIGWGIWYMNRKEDKILPKSCEGTTKETWDDFVDAKIVEINANPNYVANMESHRNATDHECGQRGYTLAECVQFQAEYLAKQKFGKKCYDAYAVMID